MLTSIHKAILEKMMTRFWFVAWDRYTYDKHKEIYYFYGWIDREKDSYKDFIVLTYWVTTSSFHFITSSVQYDQEIKDLFLVGRTPEEVEDDKCKRVENLLEISNVIKLNK